MIDDVSRPQQLSIILFGTPQLRLGHELLELVRRKNRALIYYLAAHPHPLSRDALLAFFWPDHERAAAQRILRTMVYELRKQLSKSLRVEDEILAVDAFVDVRQFETALAARNPDLASLSQALELYRGDFLHGFSLPEAPQFDDWIASEQERYRLLAVRGLEQLAQRYESRRDFTTALETLDRALAFDPLRENLQRSALRLHYLNGDRASAIRRYESLRKLLDEEMGVPPMPETRAVYDAIVTDSLQPEGPAPAQNIEVPITPHVTPAPALLPFIGRTNQLNFLKAQAALGKLILVAGEAGIGKTRLVQAFIDSGATHSPYAPLVLIGTAHELEQGLPYQSVIEALRGLGSRADWPAWRTRLDLETIWSSEITRLVPELRLVPPPSDVAPVSDESRIWEALRQFLLSLTHQVPVVLFLDDLHWADASTIAWMSYTTRRTVAPNFLLIATTRPSEPRTPLAACIQTLTRENRLAQLHLSPLTNDELETLAKRLSPQHAAPLSEWLTQQTEGNPFFITELIRYAQANSLFQSGGELDRLLLAQIPSIPPTVSSLLESRLSRLSKESRHVLDVAAVIGREFDDNLVLRTSGFGEDTALDALDELRSSFLVQSHAGGGLAFDHSLTMQGVLSQMSDTRRRALNRRVAEALEEIHRQDLAPVAGLLARHYAQANLPDRVACYAYQAGRHASSVAAWTEAIAFYEEALANETDAAQRTEVLLALGSAHFNHSDPPRASEALHSAIVLAEEQKDWVRLEQAHLAFNQTLYTQGRYVEAIAVAQELRRSCPPDLAMAAEFIWGMALSVQSAHPIEAEFHLREAERLMAAPRSFESHLTPARLEYQLAGTLGQQGKLAEAITLYRQALALVDENPEMLELQFQILLYNNLAYNLYLEGDPSAFDYVRTGLQLARDKGSLTHQPYLLSTSGEIALARNELDAAEDLFTEGLRLAQDLSIPERIAGLTANLGLVALQRGDSDLARQHLTDALARADKLSANHLATRIRIWLAPLLPPDQAREQLRDARRTAEASGFRLLLEEMAQLEHQMEDKR